MKNHRPDSDSAVWIGLQQNGAQLSWSDGTPTDYIEPVELTDRSNKCFALSNDNRWLATDCNQRLHFVCQDRKPIGQGSKQTLTASLSFEAETIALNDAAILVDRDNGLVTFDVRLVVPPGVAEDVTFAFDINTPPSSALQLSSSTVKLGTEILHGALKETSSGSSSQTAVVMQFSKVAVLESSALLLKTIFSATDGFIPGSYSAAVALSYNKREMQELTKKRWVVKARDPGPMPVTYVTRKPTTEPELTTPQLTSALSLSKTVDIKPSSDRALFTLTVHHHPHSQTAAHNLELRDNITGLHLFAPLPANVRILSSNLVFDSDMLEVGDAITIQYSASVLSSALEELILNSQITYGSAKNSHATELSSSVSLCVNTNQLISTTQQPSSFQIKWWTYVLAFALSAILSFLISFFAFRAYLNQPGRAVKLYEEFDDDSTPPVSILPQSTPSPPIQPSPRLSPASLSDPSAQASPRSADSATPPIVADQILTQYRSDVVALDRFLESQKTQQRQRLASVLVQRQKKSQLESGQK